MSQWIFSPTAEFNPMRETPSRLDKTCTSSMQERVLRAKGVRFIYDVCTDLRCHLSTISIACTFLHRFYMRSSLSVFKHYEVAATAVFLACKVDEGLRKYQDVVIKVVRAALKSPGIQVEPHHKEFVRWHEVVLRMEFAMLEVLCFDMDVELPYVFVHDQLSQLEDSVFYGTLKQHDEVSILKLAYAWISDGYRTPACVLYSADAIGFAALLMSLSFHSALHKVKDGGDDPPEILMSDLSALCKHLNLNPSDVRGARKELLSVYELKELHPTLEAKFTQHQIWRHVVKKEVVDAEDIDSLVIRDLVQFRQSMSAVPLIADNLNVENGDDTNGDDQDMEDGEVSSDLDE